VLGITALIAGVGLVALAQEDKPAADKAPTRQIGGLHFLDVSEVSVVNVDVSVIDKKGPVRGLTIADFEVMQDGKVQPLTNFVFYQRELAALAPTPVLATVPPAAPAPAPTPVRPVQHREPRFTVFYVDNENILPFNRNRVLTHLTEWVVGQLREPDQAMVASYQRSLKILQPFTSDPVEISDALRRTRKFTGGATDPINTRRQVEEYIDQHKDDSDRDTAKTNAIDQSKMFAREQRNNLTFTVGALRELIAMMSGLPGKRSLIYISDGLPLNPGQELFYEIQDTFQDPGVITQANEFDSTDLFRGLVASAASAGVTLYAIDSRGLESGTGIEAENRAPRSSIGAAIGMSNYQSSLLYFTEATGGFAVLNANDPTKGLERIADQTETYYSLGYRYLPSGKDIYHRLSVKVKGRSDVTLNYRKSFIEKSLPTRTGDRVMSGLAFELADNPLGIEISTGEPAPASNERYTLPVEIRVPIAKIALVPDGDELVGALMAYYAARDDEGKQSDLQRTEHPLRIPAAQYDTSKKEAFVITAQLLLEPGRYVISVGVRDELTNQAGYARMRTPVHPEKK
jgi:VWFA-related protein